LVEAISSLRQRSVDGERQQEKLRIEVAQLKGEARYRETPRSQDGLHRSLLRAAGLDESSRLEATAFAAHPKAICLIVSNDGPSVLIACSADSGVNAGAVLKQILTPRGGRGGGSPTLAQARVQDADTLLLIQQAFGFA
jgi:alanyl-tRNA synthetase